jgi:ribosomal-protein-alanine N-acetyltransferase
MGKKLVELMLTSCSGVKTVCLEVRASNTAAKALYEALDFEPISIRKNYYDDPREDAVIMIKKVYE